MKEDIPMFSTFDITKMTGLNRERLRAWMDKGFIVPSISANGVGTKALFTKNEVVKIGMLRNMIDLGFKRDAAAELINERPNRAAQVINLLKKD